MGSVSELDSTSLLRLDVTKNALIGVAEEMGVALQRSAYSTNIKTRKDFSCALFDARRRIIAHAFAIPSLLGSLPRLVPAVIDEYTRRAGRPLEPGEALITNDAYRGGAHLNDVAMVTPVYYRGIHSGPPPPWRIRSISEAPPMRACRCPKRFMRKGLICLQCGSCETDRSTRKS